MINRFNFYDLYGYVIPGLAFILLLGLPFGIMDPALLKMPGVSETVGLLILAYLTGHFVQIFAFRVVAEQIRDLQGHARYPSDLMLTDAHTPDSLKLGAAQRDAVIRKMQDWFGPDFASGPYGLFCRSALLQRGKAAYVEQMQGMFTLMKGLTAALLLAAAYFLGWWFSHPEPNCALVTFSLLVGVGVPLMTTVTFPQKCFIDHAFEQLSGAVFPLIAAMGSGIYLGGRQSQEMLDHLPLVPLILGSLLFAIMAWTSFRFYTVQFGRTLYREFLVLEKKEEKTPKAGESLDEC